MLFHSTRCLLLFSLVYTLHAAPTNVGGFLDPCGTVPHATRDCRTGLICKAVNQAKGSKMVCVPQAPEDDATTPDPTPTEETVKTSSVHNVEHAAEESKGTKPSKLAPISQHAIKSPAAEDKGDEVRTTPTPQVSPAPADDDDDYDYDDGDEFNVEEDDLPFGQVPQVEPEEPAEVTTPSEAEEKAVHKSSVPVEPVEDDTPAEEETTTTTTLEPENKPSVSEPSEDILPLDETTTVSEPEEEFEQSVEPSEDDTPVEDESAATPEPEEEPAEVKKAKPHRHGRYYELVRRQDDTSDDTSVPEEAAPAGAEPVVSEPPASEPAPSDPAPSESAPSEPVASDPVPEENPTSGDESESPTDQPDSEVYVDIPNDVADQIQFGGASVSPGGARLHRRAVIPDEYYDDDDDDNNDNESYGDDDDDEDQDSQTQEDDDDDNVDVSRRAVIPDEADEGNLFEDDGDDDDDEQDASEFVDDQGEEDDDN